MRINNNLMAMNTHRQLGINSNAGAKSIEKLSSGYRINRAGDDAAGLAISEKMRGQIRGLNQASRNSQDAISLVQTAEGALNETQAILQRMRELAVQSANDTNVDTDRSAIQNEIDQLTTEIDRIGNTTEFNTRKLLNGASGATSSNTTDVSNVSITGNTTAGTYTVDASAATLAAYGNVDLAGVTTATDTLGAGTVTVNGFDIAVTATDTYQDLADNINNNVTGVTAYFDTTDNTFNVRTNDVGASNSVTISESVAGVLAGTTADLTGGTTGTATNASGLAAIGGGTMLYDGNSVTVSGGTADGLSFDLKGTAADATITVNGSLSMQIGANEGQDMSVSLGDMRASALGINSIDISSSTTAKAAITTINDAITSVSTERAKLGAVQNRLEHTIKNLDTSSENLQASESRIRDVDMAKEMMEFTKNNILQQAAQSMLAQANQAPQGVLQLLR
jgi:flagellin